MEIPSEVFVHNDLVGLKGAAATLVQVSPHGFYEVILTLGDRRQRALLPVERTVIYSAEAEDVIAGLGEIER